jgi:hypothetical protein
MSDNGEYLPKAVLPPDPLIALAADPAVAALIAAQKVGWQLYHTAHAAVLQQIRIILPELAEDACIILAGRVAQAALQAASAQPITATALAEQLYTFAGPLLRHLGITEYELEELNADGDND